MQSITDYMVSQFSGMDFWDTIQIVGLILSFIYLILEFGQKASMWIVSALSSIIYACVYFNSKIYADMAFSCFNVILCIYGFYKWYNSSHNNVEPDNATNNQVLSYCHFTLPLFAKTMVASSIIWFAIYVILKHFTDSPIPALDAITTMLNIVGTWVLAQKIIEVWGIWFIVNLLSIYIYYKRGLHISTIMLYVFYLLASVYGYIKWYKKGVKIPYKNV